MQKRDVSNQNDQNNLARSMMNSGSGRSLHTAPTKFHRNSIETVWRGMYSGITKFNEEDIVVTNCPAKLSTLTESTY